MKGERVCAWIRVKNDPATKQIRREREREREKVGV